MQNEPLQERDVVDFLEYCDGLCLDSIENGQFAQYTYGVPLELLRIKDQRLFLLLGKIVDYKNIIKIISIDGHTLNSNSDNIQCEIHKYMVGLVKFTSYEECIKELNDCIFRTSCHALTVKLPHLHGQTATLSRKVPHYLYNI